MKTQKSARFLLCGLAAAGLLLSGSIGWTSRAGVQGQPPQIVKIDLPQVFPLFSVNKIRIHFKDPDGDVVFAKILPVESVNLIISSWLDPQVQGKTEGSFEYGITCTPFPSMGAAKVYLRDAAGTWSAPAFFSYVCGVPEHNYDQEDFALGGRAGATGPLSAIASNSRLSDSLPAQSAHRW